MVEVEMARAEPVGLRSAQSQSGSRVTIWNAMPTASTDVPSLVVGQASLSTSRYPSGPTASTIAEPGGVWTDGTRLVVSDTDYNRVLVWNSFPTSDGQPADFALGQAATSVIGQPSLTSAAGLTGPLTTADVGASYALYADRNLLYVADRSNYRVVLRPHE